MSSDSLDFLIEQLALNDLDDEKIFAHFCTVDKKKLKAKLKALQKISDLPYKAGGKWPSKKSFESDRNARKGKIFERLAAELLRGIKCFGVSHNVHTSTNEIDILVGLGPSANFVPALKQWGTHFICECKFHQTHISTTWVDKLRGVMQKHGANASLLISKKGIAKNGPGAGIRQSLQLYAAMTPSSYILPLDFEDLTNCVNGENLLQLINKRHIEIRTSTAILTAIAA